MKNSENQQQPVVSRRTVLRGATAGGLILGGLGLVAPSPAQAVTAPRAYTRAEWSARPPRSAVSVIGKPDHIVIHHTASQNTADFSLAAAFAVSHWIQNLHMDTNGWIDAGQQLTISRGGYLMEGRNRSLPSIANRQNVLGAQTANHNSHTIGIEHEGIYVTANVPSPLFETSVQTCAWLCSTYGLDPQMAIVGHRDYNSTQCPGDVFYARLPELRDRVAAVLAG
jgi:hypothetical protein